jgi:hypothetical protein
MLRPLIVTSVVFVYLGATGAAAVADGPSGAAVDSTAIRDTTVATSSSDPVAPMRYPKELSLDDVRTWRFDAVDTSRVHAEIGASTDVSNEQFYEEAFIDTVALGRRLVSDPETRVASLARASIEGTRGDGTTAYRADAGGTWGNRVRGGDLGLDWRHTVSETWQWKLSPRAEYRKDETFGRDLERTRATGTARLRHRWPDAETQLDMTGAGEWFHARGVGADFLPDRNTARFGVDVARSPLIGSELRAGYSLSRRDYPDSSVRNHLEHHVECSARRELMGGHSLEASLDWTRRQTRHPAPTSRDRFQDGELRLAATARGASGWAYGLTATLQRLRYDEPDSALFFDYDVDRVQLAPEYPFGAWTVRLGPRVEWLRSPTTRDEEYRELAGVLDVEWAPRGGWWSVTPVAGRRDYSDDTVAGADGTQPTPATRSSYTFVELNALADQPVPLGLRLRLLGTGRLERHTDAAEDAGSLYISCEVRRLF